MIEKVAIPATKNAIQNIARLLHNASETKKKMEEEEKKKQQELLLEKSKPISFLSRSLYSRVMDFEPIRKSEPVSVPGVGTVDKIAIAQQIAAALTAQGKSNISNEELESLTNAVVGMAEASRNSDKPVTAADFVKGLTGNTVSSNNIVTTVTPVTTTSNSNNNSNDSKNDTVHINNEKPRAKSIEKEKPIDHAAKMESLSDSDLKALLQNFKDLSSDEQHGLINFLKKLEATDSVRVERLRAYVNLGPSNSPSVKPISPVASRDEFTQRTDTRRSPSPFSTRQGTHNPCDDEENWKPKLDIFADEEEEKKKKFEDKTKAKLDLSDDDDDYTFEDIYKAADKNVIENEKAKKRTFSSRSKSKSPRSWTRSRSRSRSPRSRSPVYKRTVEYPKPGDPNAILNETKRLIANIMGDLPTKNVYKHVTPISETTNLYKHVSPISETSNLSNPPPPTSILPPVPAPTNNPNNFSQSFGMNPTPSSSQLPYSSSQFQTYPPHQPSQPFSGNSSYNGYSNFNQGYSNMGNQNQYSGDQYSSNQYPPTQSNYGGSSYGNGPPPVRPPQSYPQQPYGNYTQQGRFY